MYNSFVSNLPFMSESNFRHDFLAMLNLFSRTVAPQNIVISSTQMQARLDSDYKSKKIFRQQWVRNSTDSIDHIENALRTSVGECQEMAVICKCLLDLYLKQALSKVGWQEFSFVCKVVAASGDSDHCVVVVERVLNGGVQKYIVDPWAKGQAWPYELGMAYYHDRRNVDPYFVLLDFDLMLGNPLVEFDKPAFKQEMHGLFNRYGLYTNIDRNIRINAANFRGRPRS